MPRKLNNKLTSRLKKRRGGVRGTTANPASVRKLLYRHRKEGRPNVPPRGSKQSVQQRYYKSYFASKKALKKAGITPEGGAGGARAGAGRSRKPGGRTDRAEKAELKRQLQDEALQRATDKRKLTASKEAKRIKKLKKSSKEEKGYRSKYEAEVKRLKSDKSIVGTTGRDRDQVISDMAHRNIGGVNPVKDNLSVAGRVKRHREKLAKIASGNTSSIGKPAFGGKRGKVRSKKEVATLTKRLNEMKRSRKARKAKEIEIHLKELDIQPLNHNKLFKAGLSGKQVAKADLLKYKSSELRVANTDSGTKYYRVFKSSPKGDIASALTPEAIKRKVLTMEKRFGIGSTYTKEGKVFVKRERLKEITIL